MTFVPILYSCPHQLSLLSTARDQAELLGSLPLSSRPASREHGYINTRLSQLIQSLPVHHTVYHHKPIMSGLLPSIISQLRSPNSRKPPTPRTVTHPSSPSTPQAANSPETPKTTTLTNIVTLVTGLKRKFASAPSSPNPEPTTPNPPSKRPKLTPSPPSTTRPKPTMPTPTSPPKSLPIPIPSRPKRAAAMNPPSTPAPTPSKRPKRAATMNPPSTPTPTPTTRPKRAPRKKKCAPPPSSSPSPSPSPWQTTPAALSLFHSAFPQGSALRIPNDGTHSSLSLQCGLLALLHALQHQHAIPTTFSTLHTIAQTGHAAQMLREAGELDGESFYRLDHVHGVLREFGEQSGLGPLVLGTVMEGGGPVVLDMDGLEPGRGGRVVWIWYGGEHYEGLAGSEDCEAEIWLREDEIGKVVYEVTAEGKVVTFRAREEEEGMVFYEV